MRLPWQNHKWKKGADDPVVIIGTRTQISPSLSALVNIETERKITAKKNSVYFNEEALRFVLTQLSSNNLTIAEAAMLLSVEY